MQIKYFSSAQPPQIDSPKTLDEFFRLKSRQISEERKRKEENKTNMEQMNQILKSIDSYQRKAQTPTYSSRGLVKGIRMSTLQSSRIERRQSPIVDSQPPSLLQSRQVSPRIVKIIGKPPELQLIQFRDRRKHDADLKKLFSKHEAFQKMFKQLRSGGVRHLELKPTIKKGQYLWNNYVKPRSLNKEKLLQRVKRRDYDSEERPFNRIEEKTAQLNKKIQQVLAQNRQFNNTMNEGFSQSGPKAIFRANIRIGDDLNLSPKEVEFYRQSLTDDRVFEKQMDYRSFVLQKPRILYSQEQVPELKKIERLYSQPPQNRCKTQKRNTSQSGGDPTSKVETNENVYD